MTLCKLLHEVRQLLDLGVTLLELVISSSTIIPLSDGGRMGVYIKLLVENLAAISPVHQPIFLKMMFLAYTALLEHTVDPML